LLGGFIVGIVESFTAAYVSTQYKELFVLILLIATILIKKQGILGTEEY
jgi:branched-chain amino acid transport system permease protein